MKRNIGITVFCLIVLITPMCLGLDWPQFRGPARDGKTAETGLMKKWPDGGPELLWSVEGLGIGFSSVAVADGYVYTTGMVGKDKQGIIFAFDLDGRLKWVAPCGPEWSGPHEGARTTPTVDKNSVYVFSGNGNLVCLDSKSGQQKWAVDTLKKFDGKNLKWGLSESVLVFENKVICTPGGSNAALVALDKVTGETVWTTRGLSERAAYCSPVIYEIAGRPLITTNVEKSIVLIDPDNGNVVCRIPHEKRHDLAAVSPVYENGCLYVTTGYAREDFPPRGMMFRLAPDASGYTLGWTDRNLDCHHGGVILLDGDIHGSNSVIYGPASKEKDKGAWFCLDLAGGQIKYQGKLVGKGSVVCAEGLLYCYGENATVGLVKPTPAGYEMLGSLLITRGTAEHWAHPAISDGRLYIRHGNALMAYDIKQK
ncbi:MAG TPA: PQQ-binding-like beta-propeller repeat protein [Sedimentisphaerales bacterium]|nr:PQQ-binding-like beta-propeller repeat protein [Sedimentisphaerales bacterium]